MSDDVGEGVGVIAECGVWCARPKLGWMNGGVRRASCEVVCRLGHVGKGPVRLNVKETLSS